MGEKIYRVMKHVPRAFVEEECKVLSKTGKVSFEKVVIPVDNISNNQDPYVFYKPWLFGYCLNNFTRRTTGEGSIFIMGCYNFDYTAFYVDTVFVVKQRYGWLGDYADFYPDNNYMETYPFTTDEPVNRDYFTHRHQHKSKENLFVAKHYSGNHNSHFSFIPIIQKDGETRLIDIYHILKRDPNIDIPGREKSQNHMIECRSSTAREIYNYLKKNATHLVVETSKMGSPKELDWELEKKYFKEIYGITKQSEIKKYLDTVCFPKEKEDVLEIDKTSRC